MAEFLPPGLAGMGAMGGAIAAQQQRIQQGELAVKEGELGFKLQDLDERRQQARQKIAQESADRALSMWQGVLTDFAKAAEQSGPIPLNNKAWEIVDLMTKSASQALGMIGQDPEMAQHVTLALKQRLSDPRIQKPVAGSPGTQYSVPRINPATGEMEMVPIGGVPPTQPADVQSALFAHGGNVSAAQQTVRSGIENRNVERFSSGVPVVNDKNEYQGSVQYGDRGQLRFIDLEGNVKSVLPPGSRPSTTTNLAAGTANFSGFNKLLEEKTTTENALANVEKYMAGVNNSPEGWKLLADQWRGTLKTIAGTGNLTEEQFNVLESSGRLQGLLGQFRTEVVGGGAPSNFDMERIARAMGGEATWTRNREVVAGLLKTIVEGRLNDYNNRIVPQYNQQLKTAQRGDLKPAEPKQINEQIFGKKAAGTAARANQPGDAAVRAAQQPAQSRGARPGENLPVVTSQEDMDKLQPGDVFLDTRGNRFVK